MWSYVIGLVLSPVVQNLNVKTVTVAKAYELLAAGLPSSHVRKLIFHNFYCK